MEQKNELLSLILQLMDKAHSLELQVKQFSLHERNPFGDAYLDTDEVCDLLKICKRTLQKHRDQASISFIQFGGKTLYKTSDIKGALEKNYQAALNS
jgi:excisionase family DNA binding protein